MRRYLDARAGTHPFDHDPGAPRPSMFLISVDMIPRDSYDPDDPMREHLRTPNLDRLMGDGTRFTHAFTTSPLCGPSRAAYLTGRYPYLTVNDERAHDGMAVALRETDAIFPEYLRATGYQTAHVGKCHIGTERFLAAFGENDAPWNRWAAPMEDDDGYLRYLRDLGVQPPQWREPIRGLHPDQRTPGNSLGGWIAQRGGAELPEEATYSQYLAWLAGQSLRSALTRGDGPLYVQLDFFAPHQPFMVPECYRERARELAEHIKLPASYHEAMQGGGERWPRVYHFYRRNWGLYDPESARQYMLMNYLQIEALDAAIGRFLGTLDELGLYDDALVVFMGDHGEMNCERGLVDKGVYGHPKTALAPLSVKLPGGQGAGRTIEAPVSLLDVAPTVLGLAGVQPTERLDGESLLPLLGRERSRRQAPFIFECGWHVCPNPAVSWFDEFDGRLFMYTYNLTSDLDELYEVDDRSYPNLSDDPAHAEVRVEMIRRLGAFLQADPRWACYWHTFRLDRYEHLDIGSGDFQMFRPEH